MLIFIFLIFIFFVSATPTLELIFQTPADINTLNLYSNGVNISYNISDVVGVNASSVRFFFKTNNSASDISYYINGTAYTGFSTNSILNQSNNWTTQLDDNDIYPSKFNINQDIMENTVHAFVSLASNGAAKIEFLNVSNSTQYNIFEFMANSSVAASSLFVFYCNSSYTTGTLAINANCVQFGSISGTPNFNITNSLLNTSKYQLFLFTINTTTGKASNSIQVTPTSYFVLDKIGGGPNPWNIYEVPVGSRATASQTSANNGGAWTSQTYTFDAHIHQYQGTDTFYYYLSANDTSGNNNVSLLRSDLLQQAGMPPSVPHVAIPANQSYSEFINISYIPAISPNGYTISFYNITLANPDESYNKTIATNNSLNLSYYWNTSGTPDGSYIVKVVATDNISQTSFDLSEQFMIDNTNPTSSLTCSPSEVNAGDQINCLCGGSDLTSGVSTIIYNPNPPTDFSGDFQEICTVTDYAGNYHVSTFPYSVESRGYYSPGSAGGGSSVTSQSQNNISLPENKTTEQQINLSSQKNETINVSVENKNYSLDIIGINNNSVTFTFNGMEKEISEGEIQTFQIGSSVVTLELKSISDQGANFNVMISKKPYELNATTIKLIVATVILLILILLDIFVKPHKIKKSKHKNNLQKFK